MITEQDNTLVLFDFDGTLTHRDSFGAFLRFSHPPLKWLTNAIALSPFLLLYKLRLLSAVRVKQMVLHTFYEGWTTARMVDVAEQFHQEMVPLLLRKNALQKLEEHKAAGHTIAVVSASIDFWLVGFCREHNIELIATRMKERNTILTGELDGLNCHGPEKVARIRAAFDLKAFGHIVAYGDSAGDKEMLELATEPHYRVF